MMWEERQIVRPDVPHHVVAHPLPSCRNATDVRRAETPEETPPATFRFAMVRGFAYACTILCLVRENV